MQAVKERLICQRCGSELFDVDSEDETLTCITCARGHDLEGNLIRHPVGSVLIPERTYFHTNKVRGVKYAKED